MANFSNLITTTKGHELITRILAGEVATAPQSPFTRIVTSSAVYQLSQIEDLSDIADIRQETFVSAVARQNQTTVEIHGGMDNRDLTVGYRLNTVGVYFLDPADGLEYLFGAAIHMPTTDAPTADFIFPFNGLTTTSLLFDLFASVGNADNISFSVDPAAIVTVRALEIHNTSDTAHENRFAAVAGALEQHDTSDTAHENRFAAVAGALTQHSTSDTAHENRFAAVAGALEQHNTNGTAHENRFAAVVDRAGNIIGNHIQDGANLEAVHAAEISASPHNGNVWSWIRGRIRAGNYSGIRIGDWIQFTVSGNAIVAEVAGINTYTRAALPHPSRIPNHIDFISRDLIPDSQSWNLTSYNNGLPANPVPWMASNIRAWLNGLQTDVPNGYTANPATINVDYRATGLWPRLPQELRDVIVGKNAATSVRFSSGILLNECNGTDWGRNIGNLWLPSETEVYGNTMFGTPAFGHEGFVQYPIFANNMSKRIKRRGIHFATWFLLSPASGNAIAIATVDGSGVAISSNAVNAHGGPVCFRIA